MTIRFPISWPHKVLVPASLVFTPSYHNLHGPRAGSGLRQTLGIDAGRWTARLTLNLHSRIGHGSTLGSADRVMCYNAVAALLQGGLNTVLIPAWDALFRNPRPRAGLPAGPGKTRHTQPGPLPSSFSDGSQYQQKMTVATLAAAHALRATAVSLLVPNGETIEAGNHFGLGGDRVHVISTAKRHATIANRWELTIWPPLRADYAAGAKANYEYPRCKTVFAGDVWPDLDLAQGIAGSVALDFEEAA